MHVLRWVGWFQVSQPRVDRHDHEQNHSEEQLVSYCYGPVVAEVRPFHPRRMADALGTPVPTLAARHFSVAVGVNDDTLRLGTSPGNRSHTDSHPRELQVQLVQNESAASRCD